LRSSLRSDSSETIGAARLKTRTLDYVFSVISSTPSDGFTRSLRTARLKSSRTEFRPKSPYKHRYRSYDQRFADGQQSLTRACAAHGFSTFGGRSTTAYELATRKWRSAIQFCRNLLYDTANVSRRTFSQRYFRREQLSMASHFVRPPTVYRI